MKKDKKIVVNNKIIAELVSASSTHVVIKQQAWKTVKRVQGLSHLITTHGFTHKGHREFISGSTPFVTIPNKEEMLGPRIKTLRGAASGNAAVQHDNRHGFTLIELLVVVLIIGILAAVAVPQYQKAVLKSRVTEAKVLVKAMVDAGDLWILQDPGNDSFPPTDLDIDVPTETTNWFFEFDERDDNGCAAYADNKSNDTYGDFTIVYTSPKMTRYPVLAGKWWCSASDEQAHKTCQNILGGTLADGYDMVYILP